MCVFLHNYLQANVLYECIIDNMTYKNIFITRQNIDSNNDNISDYYYSAIYYHPEVSINIVKIFETPYIIEIENKNNIKINNFNYKNSKNIFININTPLDKLHSFSIKNIKNKNIINYICNETSSKASLQNNLLIYILGE